MLQRAGDCGTANECTIPLLRMRVAAQRRGHRPPSVSVPLAAGLVPLQDAPGAYTASNRDGQRRFVTPRRGVCRSHGASVCGPQGVNVMLPQPVGAVGTSRQCPLCHGSELPTSWVESAHLSYWDAIARTYDSLYDTAWSGRENQRVGRLLATLDLPDAPRVVDLGCGTGLGFEILDRQRPNLEYFGFDCSAEMLEVFLRRRPKVMVRRMAIGSLAAAAPLCADLVMCLSGTGSCVPCVHAVMNVARRHTKPGGWLYLSVLSRRSLRRLVSGGPLRRGGEMYRTRGDSSRFRVPMACYSGSEVIRCLESYGFVLARANSVNALSGVLEIPALWQLGAGLASVAPPLSHQLEFVAQLESACDKE